MESSSDNGNKSCLWSSTTNWTIAGGSLDTSVSVDSSDSPIDFEARAKSPLILEAPSSDYCGSCEVKIHFTQKLKVRKVCVRSTAQVYEIYFSASLWSSDEYLCTVCCSMAATDDIVHPTDAKEPAADAQSKGSTGELSKEKCIDGGNNISNEDDSGEVKLSDSSLQDNQNRSMPKKIDDNQGASIQDFHEATAEITEADACISLTLRLLSLQSKGCLYVDEIYVSIDLLELADSETQACQEGNSPEVSIMDVISPLFLHMSKAGIKQRQDKHPSDATGEVPKPWSRIAVSTDNGNEIKQEESISGLQEVNEATHVLPQFQIPAHVSDTEQRHDSVAKNNVPYAHIETALEQLVSQVRRIEDICLRVEVNMLKPISSMEARLQQIEQHVEMLTKNSQYSTLPGGTRISAPAFSCNGSDSSSLCNEGNEYPACVEMLTKNSQYSRLPGGTRSSAPAFSCNGSDSSSLCNEGNEYPVCEEMLTKNSQYSRLPCGTRISAPAFSCNGSDSSSSCNEGNEHPACGVFESEKEDAPCDKLSNPSDGMPVLVNDTRFLPCFVVTAPEFLCSDDEESNDAFETSEDCLQGKVKQALSTGDALAAALAGFSSTNSVQSSNYSKTFVVRAPDFAIEENCGDDKVVVSLGTQK